jgi:nitrate reductase NapAB chaperone NapD
MISCPETAEGRVIMISGVLVACRPECLSNMIHRVNAFQWAEVHHTDPKGRLVITIEGADAAESMNRLREIQALPNVLMAEMVECWVEDEGQGEVEGGRGPFFRRDKTKDSVNS